MMEILVIVVCYVAGFLDDISVYFCNNNYYYYYHYIYLELFCNPDYCKLIFIFFCTICLVNIFNWNGCYYYWIIVQNN